MEKSSSSPTVRLLDVRGYEGRSNDVVFCGSEAQQHVVFFPGDVQVRANKLCVVGDSDRHQIKPGREEFNKLLSSYLKVIRVNWLSVLLYCILSLYAKLIEFNVSWYSDSVVSENVT